VIRKAVASDIPAIMEIERSSFSSPWEEQLFKEALNKGFFVSIEGEEIAGYIVFEVISDEGHITDIAVSKKHRNKGIASELVKEIIRLAKENAVKQVFLEVRSSNEEAKKLYSKFGFSEIGKRKAYYSKTNEDALIFSLKI
jgi:[ribosomal protein S18]-alanine N-acetyltransferase